MDFTWTPPAVVSENFTILLNWAAHKPLYLLEALTLFVKSPKLLKIVLLQCY